MGLSRQASVLPAMMKRQQVVKDRRGHWPERRIGPTVPNEV